MRLVGYGGYVKYTEQTRVNAMYKCPSNYHLSRVKAAQKARPVSAHATNCSAMLHAYNNSTVMNLVFR